MKHLKMLVPFSKGRQEKELIRRIMDQRHMVLGKGKLWPLKALRSLKKNTTLNLTHLEEKDQGLLRRQSSTS